MAKSNVGKKPISNEEYTTNKVLAVFSVCLLGVLVLMVLQRLLDYGNTWAAGMVMVRVLLGIGVVGIVCGIVLLVREGAGKRERERRIVCGRNVLIVGIAMALSMAVIGYMGTQPIKMLYVILPVLAVYYLVYHSCAGVFPDCSGQRCGARPDVADASRAGFRQPWLDGLCIAGRGGSPCGAPAGMYQQTARAKG